MFSVAINSHCNKEKMYKFRIPRKNQHWVYFYHSNLKVGPFGPPAVALGLNKRISIILRPSFSVTLTVLPWILKWGVDWRALINSRPFNIGNLREQNFVSDKFFLFLNFC